VRGRDDLPVHVHAYASGVGSYDHAIFVPIQGKKVTVGEMAQHSDHEDGPKSVALPCVIVPIGIRNRDDMEILRGETG
jgi:hypothetical protein